jgi:tripartite-type tricarboxylate transporter receptor subunit TctC
VRILVGFAAGGGFDTYARAIGRHLGKHIPGNPAVVVENMPGGGSLIAANHLYKVASRSIP